MASASWTWHHTPVTRGHLQCLLLSAKRTPAGIARKKGTLGVRTCMCPPDRGATAWGGPVSTGRKRRTPRPNRRLRSGNFVPRAALWTSRLRYGNFVWRHVLRIHMAPRSGCHCRGALFLVHCGCGCYDRALGISAHGHVLNITYFTSLHHIASNDMLSMRGGLKI
jgi:hypothetical protein